MNEPKNDRVTAASRYLSMTSRRQQFLDRARRASKYTIPSLIPEEGMDAGQALHANHQSIGARAVNNLANKLLLALLPPTRKFFRLTLSDDLKAATLPGEASQIELALSKLEDKIVREIERRAIRVHSYEIFRHLIVGGNVLVFLDKKSCRVFPLAQYVIRRAPEGKILEIVLKERLAIEEVPEEIAQEMRKTPSGSSQDKMVDMYTHVCWCDEGGEYKVHQEIAGIIVPGSEGTYTEARLPWVALRWGRIEGEDYGRGHADDHIGDIMAVEKLSRSLIRSAAICAKTVFLVNPNSATDVEDLVNAEEGGFVQGLQEDVKPLQADRYADMSFAKTVLDDCMTRVSYAFLLNSAVRRQGERVTAEEIRYMASELEDGLGGAYSILSVEYQLPVVRVVMADMRSTGDLPNMKENTVEPTVITGIDALGRSHELARLDAFIGGALQTFGPNVMQYIKMDEYLRRRAAGLDLDIEGLIPSPEELQAQQQAATEQNVLNAVGPQLVQGMAKQAAPQPTA
jgi:hypothetical protein